MKISVNWLKDFVPSVPSDIASLVDKLTFLGLEVEDVFTTKLPGSSVVVGKVVEVRPHPNADRLRVCKVDAGQAEPLQIVCGAPNVAEGQLVPVAMIGAKLATPDGGVFKIKKSKIRGEQSFGMICAADELGLSGDHSGIMVLEEHCEIGEPLSRYLDADTVLDIAVTPNRPDVLSHLGVAREIAGIAHVTVPQVPAVEFSSSGELVRIEDADACLYYTGVVIRNVSVEESPSWLKQKLESIGLRPRNNIVDITNYVLHALGQPLHAFDLSKLDGECVRIRTDITHALTAINQESYELKPGMPVICDQEKPVALAGVMGGYDSAVTETTTDILLESAYFSPADIRKTSKALGLTSDSAYRFERGVDPGNVRFAARFAVKLILELAGGEITAAEEAGQAPLEDLKVALRPHKAEEILGCSIASEKMIARLEFIGFIAMSDAGERIEFSVPSFRVDVTQEIDLIEEIARLEGYDNIPVAERMVASYPQSRRNQEYFSDYLRSVMIGLQFREILSNPLLTKREASFFEHRAIPVLNPISEGLEVLRPSLIPSVLKIISHNIKHGKRSMRFFELARVYYGIDEKNGADGECYKEKEVLVIALTGDRYPVNWSEKQHGADFFDLKGSVEMMLEWLNLLDKSFLNLYNETTLCISCNCKDGDKEVQLKACTLQQLTREMLDAFAIDQPVYIAEIDTEVLDRCYTPEVTYRSPSKYPVVQRDLSFILPEGAGAQQLVDCVKTSDPLISSVQVFDLFERDPETAAGKTERSIALSLDISDPESTLHEETVKEIIRRVTEKAESELGAVIRQV